MAGLLEDMQSWHILAKRSREVNVAYLERIKDANVNDAIVQRNTENINNVRRATARMKNGVN